MIIAACKDNLVVRGDSLDLDKKLLNLGWEYIDTLDDKHVVDTAEEPVHLDGGPSAGTLFSVQVGDIPCPVADKRSSLLLKCCNNKLSLLAIRQNLASRRVDHFWIEKVFVHMQTALNLALAGYTRTGDLCKSVDVVSLDSQLLLDLLAHIVAPWLCTHAADPKFKLIAVYTHLCQHLGYIEGVGWGTCHHCCPEVAHEVDLPLGVS